MPSSQSTSRLVVLIALAAAAVAALFVAGRVSLPNLPGGGEGDPAARQAIDRAFSNSNFRSGRFRATFTATFQGADLPQFGGRIAAEMKGAFNDRGSGKPPQLDMTIKANVPQDMQFRVVSTGRKGFASVGGRTYKATDADFARMYGQLGRPQDQLGLAPLGVQPADWMRDEKLEGSTVVRGVETDHLSANLDIDELADDLVTVSSKYRQPGAQELSPKDAEEFKDAVQDARLDVYASKKDGSLRQAVVHLELKADDGSGDLDFSLDFLDVNEPQKIVAPVSARPFSQADSDLRTGLLSPAAAAGAPGGASVGSRSEASVEATALPAETQAYLACVRKASDAAALRACSSYLP